MAGLWPQSAPCALPPPETPVHTGPGSVGSSPLPVACRGKPSRCPSPHPDPRPPGWRLPWRPICTRLSVVIWAPHSSPLPPALGWGRAAEEHGEGDARGCTAQAGGPAGAPVATERTSTALSLSTGLKVCLLSAEPTAVLLWHLSSSFSSCFCSSTRRSSSSSTCRSGGGARRGGHCPHGPGSAGTSGSGPGCGCSAPVPHPACATLPRGPSLPPGRGPGAQGRSPAARRPGTARHTPKVFSLLILQVKGPSWIIFLVVRSRLCQGEATHLSSVRLFVYSLTHSASIQQPATPDTRLSCGDQGDRCPLPMLL